MDSCSLNSKLQFSLIFFLYLWGLGGQNKICIEKNNGEEYWFQEGVGLWGKILGQRARI